MYEFLIGLYVIVAIIIISLILVQRGKGSDISSGVGGGSSIFGSSGSSNFLSKTTSVCVVLFFILNILIGQKQFASVESNKIISEIIEENDVPIAIDSTEELNN